MAPDTTDTELDEEKVLDSEEISPDNVNETASLQEMAEAELDITAETAESEHDESTMAYLPADDPLEMEPYSDFENIDIPTPYHQKGTFTCSSCFLLKSVNQLADKESMTCVDCTE